MCFLSGYPAVSLKVITSTYKGSRTEFELPVFHELLLVALTVTHAEARGPAVTPQRSGFGPRSAS